MAAKGTRTRFSDQLRQGILAADKSRYAICKETGIDQATLSRFMSGKGGLSVDGIDRLIEVLKMDLVPRQPRQKGR